MNSCYIKRMQLNNDEIHIWSVPLTLSPRQEAYLSGLLSVDEVQRKTRLKFVEHQRRFAMARGALREILSFYLPVEPSAIQFNYTENNKPTLALDTDSPLHFNLSHADELAVYAIARQLVGVDIEKIQPSYSPELVSRYFPLECKSLQALPPDQQAVAFYRLWARKEAIIKASGRSLANSLSKFTVSPLDVSEEVMLASQAWYVQPLTIGEAFASALASERLPQRIEYYHYKLWE